MSRRKTVTAYWQFVYSYAATNQQGVNATRRDPEFKDAYQRYRESIRLGEEGRLQQLEALFDLGWITEEEFELWSSSPR